MIEEQISPQTPLNTIDPCYRVIAAVLFSVVVALSYRPETLISAFIGAFVFIILARINFFLVVRKLSVLLGFLLLLWIVLPISYDGFSIMQIGPFHIAREGIVLALQITAKSTAILMAFLALIATMPVATLGHSLGRLGLPDKIVHLLLITYRYIFVIEQEYHRLITAIKIRGFRPKTNLHSYRTYAYLVGMLFVRASIRAQRVNQAMRCRGFQGKFYSLYQFRSTPLNYYFLSGFAGLFTILVGLEWFF